MEKYNLKEGEELHVIEQNEGFTLTPYDPEFEKWTENFKRTNEKYKNTLKALSE
jgi:bifunctional DNA-binding transcriptional regulator/antitoxin component of YhaV-PrlF toxin-antitoxin module